MSVEIVIVGFHNAWPSMPHRMLGEAGELAPSVRT